LMFLLLQELYTSKCVYHVSEQAFTMSPVYTEGGLAPALYVWSKTLLCSLSSSLDRQECLSYMSKQ
jgi:hypothetical protein